MTAFPNQTGFPTRYEANATAASLLREFIRYYGLTERRFAQAAGVSPSTLRYFLSNGAATNTTARRHGRGPYVETLKPLLKLPLSEELREALMNAIFYEERATARLLGTVNRPMELEIAQTSE
jgi:hypothetical protein